MSDDRRAVPRRDAFRIATLRVDAPSDAQSAAIECLVWDISETGAQVEVAITDVVPDRVLLRIDSEAPPRPCTVVRRAGRTLGLRFDA